MKSTFAVIRPKQVVDTFAPQIDRDRDNCNGAKHFHRNAL